MSLKIKWKYKKSMFSEWILGEDSDDVIFV